MLKPALITLFNFKSYAELNKAKIFELRVGRNLKGHYRNVHEGMTMTLAS
jgi:hypothetical protein